MKRYNFYQVIASICVAFFIVSFSLCLVSKDRKIYEYTLEKYEGTITVKSEDGQQELTDFEAKLCYELIADDVTSFSGGDYNIPGYSVYAVNAEKLDLLNSYCRGAWLISGFTFVVAVYCFIVLSRRRMYMPFIFGGVLAAFITSVSAFVVMNSHKEVLSGIKAMILKKDYSYFTHGDIVSAILPPDFAGNLAIAYIVTVLLLIILMVVVRALIAFSGRPHKF